ncbi:EamA family transporter [Pelagicoccus sp. SDUM812003]|uniref:EamA family transporter n=1 Tax=Pelagicoccus sp. SDUM812003 TaxID=3041267 RepID=UPI00280C79EB|nr:EamA family transporter [Pelagicoccus sp. SDUM812003]MDQ8202493.1 EamA family transporter [Pelagicoccus sp. SDUM812003]
MGEEEKASRVWIVVAFATLYVIWGSTYLAIKVAIETMPPFLMATARFVLAGAVLYAIARLTGARRPSRENWKHAAIVGSMLMAGGNGVVSLAERWIDSGLAALIIGSSPILMTLFGWWANLERRPDLGVWASLLGGFTGVAFLVASSSGVESEGGLLGSLLVVLAMISWTLGCVFSKRHPQRINLWLQSGMQMFCGGLTCLLIGALLGEFDGFYVSEISMRSWMAFGYLIVFGSFAGFTSYVYVLKHCAPSAVASHAYVNPAVAVFLGWLILGETMSASGIAGSILILASVYALLKRKAKEAPVERLATSPERSEI